MPTKIQPGTPTPSGPKSKVVHKSYDARRADRRTVVIIFGDGQESIVHVVADVLGKRCRIARSFTSLGEQDGGLVFGILAQEAKTGLKERDKSMLVVINAHGVDASAAADEFLSKESDYEFLYSQKQFSRRDLARFLALSLGQINHHEELVRKTRTSFMSTTFPDVRTALSNLDILSVGSDAVEIRVDLLKEPRPDGSFSAVPSLKYVGEQVMLLRQRTELPIIYTTRCTRENGRFPMDDPNLYYDYLYRAMQWGVEYIDVELWLPEDIRKRLADQKGNSKIISAFHDFSGKFKWTSADGQRIFQEGAKYGDIVRMIAMADAMSENYELECFRSMITSDGSHPPLSAVNAGQMGQLSRALNTVFSPVTHPLLPMIAAPGQLSAAEINGALHVMGQMPKRDIYAIGISRSITSMFFEKCFNELGLPHHFACVDRDPDGSIEAFVMQPNFGGAYILPPLASSQPYIPILTDAARSIGLIDTVVVRTEGKNHGLVGNNATWKGIRATLTHDFVPSAYSGRAALVISSSGAEAASAIFALRSLDIGTIYAVGFIASGVEPSTSIESMPRIEQPFVVISALPPEKSHLVQPLLRHFSNSTNGEAGVETVGKVFVDLTIGPRKCDPLAVAAASGWTAYGIADVSAWTTVEMLRLLVGQNVPYGFVRMTSGRGLF